MMTYVVNENQNRRTNREEPKTNWHESTTTITHTHSERDGWKIENSANF